QSLSCIANSNTMSSLDVVIDASPFLSLHRDLVQIASISGSELKVVSFIAAFLEARNFTLIKQPMDGGKENRFNILAYPASLSSQQPEVILTSHIDTVPPFIPYALSHVDSQNNSTNDKDNIRIAG